MKVIDYISKYIQDYPSLYKDINYERSKLKLLNHTFFVIGNGVEFAQTDNPNEGGYMVLPKYKKDRQTDGYVRVKDKPYGAVKHKPLPKDYFETDIYYVSNGIRPIDIRQVKHNRYDQDFYFRFRKGDDLLYNGPTVFKAESLHNLSPYPIAFNHSNVADIYYNNLFLQDDWMAELVLLCKYTLEYYTDETQYVNSHHYPSEDRIKYAIRIFNDTYAKEGIKGVLHLRDIWGYEAKDTVPDYDEVRLKKEKSWAEFHKSQVDFLNLFITKYDNK